MFQLSHFSRKIGSKDKHKRLQSTRRQKFLKVAAISLPVALTAPMIGQVLGKRVATIPKHREAKQLIEQSKRQVFEDAYQELVRAGVPFEHAHYHATQAQKEYENVAGDILHQRILEPDNTMRTNKFRLVGGLIGGVVGIGTPLLVHKLMKTPKQSKKSLLQQAMKVQQQTQQRSSSIKHK